MPTKIPWTDETWNFLGGCTSVSEGCLHCAAAASAQLCVNRGNKKYEGLVKNGKWTGEVRLFPDELDKPLHWRKPRMIFPAFMGDLFHESVPFEFILKIFGLSMVTPWHTYQILTKRIKRTVLFFEWWREQQRKERCLYGRDALALSAVGKLPVDYKKANQYWLDNFDQSKRGKLDYPIPYPQPNIHLGVSISTQKEADEKIPILLQIPAAVRFVSLEPMLEAVGLRATWTRGVFGGADEKYPKIDWVIIGCESINGRAGRFCEDEAKWWDAAHSLIDQGKAADVPIFFKQGPLNGKVSRDPNDWPEWARLQEYLKLRRN